MRKPMSQWMLKITEYADRLLEDLEELDWPESIKEMQRNWIGRSEGAEVTFKIEGHDEDVRRLYDPSGHIVWSDICVLAPEHDLVKEITTAEQQDSGRSIYQESERKSDLERTDLAKEKTGVFTGAYAINPVNGERMPIWIADYVLGGYGTGAIMAVPGTTNGTMNLRRNSICRSLKSSKGGDIAEGSLCRRWRACQFRLLQWPE